MTTDTIPQTVLFPDLFDKPLVATFDRQHASSDGGAVLLKAAERLYGLVAGFARCLVDRRQPGKVRHTLAELRGQRIFGIACGHPDGNDADHLADDPIHKLLLGRDPVAGEALASQPTISRFENGVGRSALHELAPELAMRVIKRHQRRLDGRPRRITTDLDPTDDATIDQLPSYAAACRTVMPSVVHLTDPYANNRAEVSHQPMGQRERQMPRFTSVAHAQQFASVPGVVQNLFRVGRHLLRSRHHRVLRRRAFVQWDAATCAC